MCVYIYIYTYIYIHKPISLSLSLYIYIYIYIRFLAHAEEEGLDGRVRGHGPRGATKHMT